MNPVPLPPRRDYLWYGIVAATCLVILGFGLKGQLEYEGIAFAIGYYLPQAAVVWLVVGLGLGRKQSRLERTAAFGAIYITFMLGGILSHAVVEREAKIMASALVKEVSPHFGPDTFGKQVETDISNVPKSSGDVAVIETFMRGYVNELTQLRNDYLKEIEAKGVGVLLEPQRLTQDRNLEESERILSNLRPLPAIYAKKTREVLSGARTTMEQMDIARHVKRDVLNGFDSGMKKTGPELETQWKLEQAVIEEMTALIADLKQAGGRFAYQNKMLMFERQEDLDAYNRHLETIKAIVAKQEAMQERSAAKFKSLAGA